MEKALAVSCLCFLMIVILVTICVAFALFYKYAPRAAVVTLGIFVLVSVLAVLFGALIDDRV